MDIQFALNELGVLSKDIKTQSGLIYKKGHLITDIEPCGKLYNVFVLYFLKKDVISTPLFGLNKTDFIRINI